MSTFYFWGEMLLLTPHCVDNAYHSLAVLSPHTLSPFFENLCFSSSSLPPPPPRQSDCNKDRCRECDCDTGQYVWINDCCYENWYAKGEWIPLEFINANIYVRFWSQFFYCFSLSFDRHCDGDEICSLANRQHCS
jgi:hypothetical protein